MGKYCLLGPRECSHEILEHVRVGRILIWLAVAAWLKGREGTIAASFAGENPGLST